MEPFKMGDPILHRGKNKAFYVTDGTIEFATANNGCGGWDRKCSNDIPKDYVSKGINLYWNTSDFIHDPDYDLIGKVMTIDGRIGIGIQIQNTGTILTEVIEGHGWSRGTRVPTDYVSKYTDTYYYMNSDETKILPDYFSTREDVRDRLRREFPDKETPIIFKYKGDAYKGVLYITAKHLYIRHNIDIGILKDYVINKNNCAWSYQIPNNGKSYIDPDTIIKDVPFTVCTKTETVTTTNQTTTMSNEITLASSVRDSINASFYNSTMMAEIVSITEQGTVRSEQTRDTIVTLEKQDKELVAIINALNLSVDTKNIKATEKALADYSKFIEENV